MSSALVYDAIKARLIDQLGGAYPVRDWEEIETSLQKETAPWLAVEDGGGNNDMASIGSPSENWMIDDGFIDIHVMVPSTTGLSPARTIAEQVRDVLLQYQFSVSSGTLRSVSVNPPVTGFLFNGLWHSMLITVDYTHQYVRATAA